MADRESLSEAERRRFAGVVSFQFQGRLQHYEFARDGTESTLQGEFFENQARWRVRQPGIAQRWGEWGFQYPQEFRDHVDGLIREGEAAE